MGDLHHRERVQSGPEYREPFHPHPAGSRLCRDRDQVRYRREDVLSPIRGPGPVERRLDILVEGVEVAPDDDRGRFWRSEGARVAGVEDLNLCVEAKAPVEVVVPHRDVSPPLLETDERPAHERIQDLVEPLDLSAGEDGRDPQLEPAAILDIAHPAPG